MKRVPHQIETPPAGSFVQRATWTPWFESPMQEGVFVRWLKVLVRGSDGRPYFAVSEASAPDGPSPLEAYEDLQMLLERTGVDLNLTVWPSVPAISDWL